MILRGNTTCWEVIQLCTWVGDWKERERYVPSPCYNHGTII